MLRDSKHFILTRQFFGGMVSAFLIMAMGLFIYVMIRPPANKDPIITFSRVVIDKPTQDYCIQLTEPFTPVSGEATPIPPRWCYVTPTTTWTPYGLTNVTLVTATPTAST